MTQFKIFLESLFNALRGLNYVVKTERNFQIELIFALIVIVLSLIFQIRGWEAIVLTGVIVWVLVAELLNTVLEKIVDILKPRIHPYARIIKDIMAAVVLISSMLSVVVGVIIFWPHFVSLLK